MSIALLAIVIVGGANYLSTDIGVRTETVRQVATSRNAIEGALASYRVANRGALPPVEASDEDTTWKAALDGYMAPGGLSAPVGMTWRYVQGSQGTLLCLETDDGHALSNAVLSGLERAAGTDGILQDGCAGPEVESLSAASIGGQPALVVPIKIAE